MIPNQFICKEDIYPYDFIRIIGGTMAMRTACINDWNATGQFIAISGGKKGETTTAMPITPDIVWEVQA